MPENSAARINGFANGNGNGNTHHNGFESEDGQTFLFTSESVGEGHPGKNYGNPISSKLNEKHSFSVQHSMLLIRIKIFSVKIAKFNMKLRI
jgi:hypothetical protein